MVFNTSRSKKILILYQKDMKKMTSRILVKITAICNFFKVPSTVKIKLNVIKLLPDVASAKT